MNKIRYATLPSPVGRLLFVGDGEAVVQLHMEDPSKPPEVEELWLQDERAFSSPKEQLKAYFAGDLTEFDIHLDASGTTFQRRVWDALGRIPFGTTASYIDVARSIGAPKGARPVGAANARNPIAIVVPCHRVIGASGKLTGYAGGLDRKEKLLNHETEVLLRLGAR